MADALAVTLLYVVGVFWIPILIAAVFVVMLLADLARRGNMIGDAVCVIAAVYLLIKHLT